MCCSERAQGKVGRRVLDVQEARKAVSRQLRPTFTGSSTPRPSGEKHLLPAGGFVPASDPELIGGMSLESRLSDAPPLCILGLMPRKRFQGVPRRVFRRVCL